MKKSHAHMVMFHDQMETIKRPQQLIKSANSICCTATSIQSILELIFQFAPSTKTLFSHSGLQWPFS